MMKEGTEEERVRFNKMKDAEMADSDSPSSSMGRPFNSYDLHPQTSASPDETPPGATRRGSPGVYPARTKNNRFVRARPVIIEPCLHEDDQVTSIMVVMGERVSFFKALVDANNEIRQCLDDGCLAWFDLSNPTMDDIKCFEEEFGIHTLTVEDISEQDSLEKTEIFDDYRCVLVHEMQADGVILTAKSFIILLFKHAVVSIHFSHLSKSASVLQTIKDAKCGMPSPDWVVYALLDAVVDSFIPLVDSLVGETTNLDHMMLSLSQDDQRDFFTRIRIARQKLNKLRSTLLAKREILQDLFKSSASLTPSSPCFISESSRVYLRDVLDEVNRLLQKLESSDASLTNIPVIFLAKLSVESAVTANDLAASMKKLSAIATLMLPPTLVAGIFGMNTPYPGMAGYEDSFGPFFIVCGFILAMIIVLYYYMRGAKWL